MRVELTWSGESRITMKPNDSRNWWKENCKSFSVILECFDGGTHAVDFEGSNAYDQAEKVFLLLSTYHDERVAKVDFFGSDDAGDIVGFIDGWSAEFCVDR